VISSPEIIGPHMPGPPGQIDIKQAMQDVLKEREARGSI